ncbi:MAG: DUF420 domain-containing protein [Planctomycetia bacterium]|nr:DUF420 domain-containing protein [Planctomycetia bacterium]
MTSPVVQETPGARRAVGGNVAIAGAAAGLVVLVALAAALGWQFPQQLPHVNAALNGTATVLLLAGYLAIKRRRETAHKRLMLTAFAASILFLTCYVVYHAQVGSVPFPRTGAIRGVYRAILVSHIVLAAAVPVLASITIALALRDRRAAHRKLARWTFPIWLYVSVTGVVIYLMLYHLPPARG